MLANDAVAASKRSSRNFGNNVNQVHGNILGFHHTTQEHKGVSRATMGLYGRVIGPKLKDALDELQSTMNMYDVSEEISHTRQVHLENMRLYSAVFENDKLDADSKVQALQMAGKLISASSDDVLKALERAARIQSLAADKLAPNTLDAIVKQICQYIYLAFDMPDITENDGPALIQQKLEAKERIRKFDLFLNEQLQLVSLKSLGTSITPDQQVMAMDDSIPYVEMEQ